MTAPQSIDVTEAPRRIYPGVALVPLLAAAAFAYWPLFSGESGAVPPGGVGPSEEWFFSPAGGSPILAYVIAGWLVVRRSARVLGGGSGRAARMVGVVGVVMALMTMIWGDYVSAPSLWAPSLAVLLVAVATVLAGRAGGQAMLLPAVYLVLLATPWPVPLLNRVLYPLQEATAVAVAGAVNLVGLRAVHSGALILTSHGVFHVIETCAGLRTIQTLVMSAVVYAEVFHCSRRRLLALCVAAPIIGLFVNLLRVFSLVVTPLGANQPAHTLQGVLMLVVGVLILAGIDLLLSRWRPGPSAPERSSGRDPRVVAGAAPIPVAVVVGLTTSVLVAGIARVSIEPWQVPRSTARSVHDLPRDLGGWLGEAEPLDVDRDFFGTTRFSQRTHRRYNGEVSSVELFLGINDRLRPHMGLVSPKTQILRAGWTVVECSPLRGGPAWDDAQELVLREPGGAEWLAWHGYQDIAGLGMETARSMLVLDRGPLRRDRPARVTRFSTKIMDRPDGHAEARAVLQQFADRVLPELGSIGLPSAEPQSQ